jgi:hypothetical protein
MFYLSTGLFVKFAASAMLLLTSKISLERIVSPLYYHTFKSSEPNWEKYKESSKYVPGIDTRDAPDTVFAGYPAGRISG